MERVLNIIYLPVRFKIQFETEIIPDNNFLFVIRSVLGKNLRKICCIAHTQKCPACMYARTCAYSTIFESIIANDNEILPGRDRSSHPFSLQQEKFLKEKDSIKYFVFKVTLFGKTCNFLPYIYAALYKAGEDGLFKNRVKFSIEEVLVNEKNIISEDGMSLLQNYKPECFEMTDNAEKKEGEILLEIKSPLRFKTNGKYSADFSAADFYKALWRRAKTLFLMYSEETSFMDLPECDCEITDRHLIWKDIKHYSARQKDVMSLGGVTGTFKLTGKFTKFELKLLEFNRIANAGKNTNFGLGQID